MMASEAGWQVNCNNLFSILMELMLLKESARELTGSRAVGKSARVWSAATESEQSPLSDEDRIVSVSAVIAVLP